jgi:hypothetical protein
LVEECEGAIAFPIASQAIRRKALPRKSKSLVYYDGEILMAIKLKRLVNPYEERMLKFLQTCIDQ